MILSLIGHRFADGPRTPTLFVLPTQKLAGSMSADRVSRILRECPALDEIHSKGKSDSKFEKWLGGVPLRFAWAGSATELAAHPCGMVLIDELDRMDRDVAGEGDPVTLARARTKNYIAPLLVVTSSPSYEDASAIQAQFDNGSGEMWEIACTHCGEHHRPLGRYLVWQDGAAPGEAARTVAYACPHCGADLSEQDRQYGIANGRFRPYQRDPDGNYLPSDDPISDYSHRSFWVSGLASPWVSWSDMARELCASYRSRDPETIRAAINTYLGELWRVRGDAPDWHEVAAHRQAYRQPERPWGVQVVTAGVDVQSDRLYYVVRGWGAEQAPMESWLLEHGELHGRTDLDEVWISLGQVLRRHELQIRRCLIDSGYKPGLDWFKRPDHAVYQFSRRHQPIAYAAKGYEAREKPVDTSLIDVTTSGGATIKNGVKLYRVDVGYFKSWIYSRVAVGEDGASDVWHLPSDVSEDYMRQVVSEELLETASGRMRWIARRTKPNHFLDCEVLATAAAHSLNAYTLPALPARAADAQANAPPQAPPRPPRRFQRGGL
jgi:phage terminase large subunit GpA-like protein